VDGHQRAASVRAFSVSLSGEKSSGPFEKRAFTALLEQPAMFPGPAATQLERKSSKEVCL